MESQVPQSTSSPPGNGRGRGPNHRPPESRPPEAPSCLEDHILIHKETLCHLRTQHAVRRLPWAALERLKVWGSCIQKQEVTELGGHHGGGKADHLEWPSSGLVSSQPPCPVWALVLEQSRRRKRGSSGDGRGAGTWPRAQLVRREASEMGEPDCPGHLDQHRCSRPHSGWGEGEPQRTPGGLPRLLGGEEELPVSRQPEGIIGPQGTCAGQLGKRAQKSSGPSFAIWRPQVDNLRVADNTEGERRRGCPSFSDGKAKQHPQAKPSESGSLLLICSRTSGSPLKFSVLSYVTWSSVPGDPQLLAASSPPPTPLVCTGVANW